MESLILAWSWTLRFVEQDVRQGGDDGGQARRAPDLRRAARGGAQALLAELGGVALLGAQPDPRDARGQSNHVHKHSKTKGWWVGGLEFI